MRQGTFTDFTEPTYVEVELLIDQSLRDVQMFAGAIVSVAVAGQARDLAALRAAIYVEASYYPEQINENASLYQVYLDLWNSAVGSPDNPGWFVKAVQESETDESLDVAGESGDPVYNFPPGPVTSLTEKM